MTHLGKGSEEFYSVQEAGRDPLMDGSWMVGIKVKFQASLTFWFMGSAVFIWREPAPCEK